MSTIRQDDPSALIAAARASGRKALGEPTAKAVLARFGIAVPRGVLAASAADVAEEADRLSPPMAVKLVSPDVIHKSDAGAVRIGVRHAAAAGRIAKELAALARTRGWHVDGFLVEEMAPAGRELVIGGTIDPRFGPVIMTGLGGVFVEIFKDVSFRICPIERWDAEEMLAELKGAALLGPVRGAAAAHRDSLVEALLRIGGSDGLLFRLGSEIAELDINPLIVSDRGAVAADARIILASAS
jgi:succinyl-CoA synthetase beta subunit